MTKFAVQPTEAVAASAETKTFADALRLVMPDEMSLSNDLLLDMGARNEGLRFESDADGALLIMAPAGPASGRRGVRISSQLQSWADANAGGDVFDASSIFQLPDGNRRSPDVAWISPARLSEVVAGDEGVWQVTPDLVIEIRSLTDDIERLRKKMELWLRNGMRLGWLVDPFEQRIWVYRPNAEPLALDRPTTIADDEVLPGLAVDLRRIWR